MGMQDLEESRDSAAVAALLEGIFRGSVESVSHMSVAEAQEGMLSAQDRAEQLEVLGGKRIERSYGASTAS